MAPSSSSATCSRSASTSSGCVISWKVRARSSARGMPRLWTSAWFTWRNCPSSDTIAMPIAASSKVRRNRSSLRRSSSACTRSVVTSTIVTMTAGRPGSTLPPSVGGRGFAESRSQSGSDVVDRRPTTAVAGRPVRAAITVGRSCQGNGAPSIVVAPRPSASTCPPVSSSRGRPRMVPAAAFASSTRPSASAISRPSCSESISTLGMIGTLVAGRGSGVPTVPPSRASALRRAHRVRGSIVGGRAFTPSMHERTPIGHGSAQRSPACRYVARGRWPIASDAVGPWGAVHHPPKRSRSTPELSPIPSAAGMKRIQPASTPPELLRNFCIIAHIDHGKSTLADRMLQLTGVVDARAMRAQYLDRMDIERERGITIKSQAVRMPWAVEDADGVLVPYALNMIDTPGHVDFTYEVSRSLAASEGAVLLVDAAQGIEAQTLANLYLALEKDLQVIPVLNKIDLPAAQPEKYAEELARLVGGEPEDVLRVSGKTGEGVGPLLDRIVQLVPHPTGDPDAPARAMIFDSVYDTYRGVVTYVRVVDGNLNPRE